MFPSCYSKTTNGAHANTSVGKVVVGVFVVYVLHTCWVLHGFVYTKPCDTSKGDNCIFPYLAKKSQLSIFSTSDPSDLKGHSLLHKENEFNVFTKFERTLNVSLPEVARNNGTLFAVIYVHSGSGPPWEDSRHVSYITRLTSYTTQHPPEVTTGLNEAAAEEGDEEPQSPPAPGAVPAAPVHHWHSRLCLSVMAEFSFSRGAVPSDVRRYLKVLEEGKRKIYLPLVVVDELQIRMRDFTEINESTTGVHLTVSYENISLRKFRLLSHLRDVMYSLKQFGFSERQVDDIKGVITDTNIYVLALTIFAAVLNILFEILAIKNDIGFWRKKTTMAGMSKRTVVWRCFSTLVIFLHLLVEQRSRLLLIPTGVGVVLELWKLLKAFSIQDDKFDEPERITAGYDSQGMRFLSYLLCPLCVSGVTYSFLYVRNRSWYSWLLSSLVTGVYAFGFLSGFPQLYLNYKLKSVEHVQSSIYMYKGMSTFINDILSTILTVPTHPLACFRDDVLCLLHLYQRRLYPVRKTRGREYGACCRQRLKGKPHED